MARMQVLVAALSATAAAAAATPSLLFVGRDLTKNDFYAAAAAYPTRQKYATIDAALAAAKPRDGLMLCADGILPAATQPQTNTTVAVTARQWSKAAALQLRVYLEFPRSLPPSDGTALPVAQTLWERAVVTQDLGPALPKMELLHPHKHVDFVKLPASWLPRSLIVIAKVAGYDKAELGLPPANVTWPMLTMQSDTLLVASTQLSHCRTRRFAPSEQWMAVAAHVLTWATNGSWHAPKAPCSPPQPCPPPPPLWTPSVTASFSATEKLPPDAELQALVRGVQFYRNARLIPDATRATALARLHCKSADSSNNCSDFANLRAPYAQRLSGEGQLGIFEGLTSDIDLLGRQPQSIGVRADCVTESSASFAVRGRVTKNSSDLLVGTNLLSYAHIHAGYTQPWIVGAGAETDASRPWTASGDAFGLLSWTTADAAYELYYKDDDARGMLGAIATASLVQSDRWHTTLVTAILGNLRTTPKNGFGPLSGGFSTMVSELGPGHDGWRAVYDSAGGHPSFSPHYSSYIWAVHLWAYSRCGFAPLLERPMAALKIMMTNYPTKWVPTSNGIAMQRARIILPLAFLVRANDTALHREWLNTAVSGFMTRRNCTKTATAHWCAYKEELSHPGWGGSTRVPDNANYGTFEVVMLLVLMLLLLARAAADALYSTPAGATQPTQRRPGFRLPVHVKFCAARAARSGGGHGQRHDRGRGGRARGVHRADPGQEHRAHRRRRVAARVRLCQVGGLGVRRGHRLGRVVG